jgi:hypothetical protein
MKNPLTTRNRIGDEDYLSKHPAREKSSGVAVYSNNSALSRTDLRNISRAPNSSTHDLITQTLGTMGQAANQTGGLIANSFGSFSGLINKLSNGDNNSFKLILASFAGISLSLIGIVNGLKNLFDAFTGKHNGKFRLGEILAGAMAFTLGRDALNYAQGKVKDKSFNSFQGIAKKFIPLVLMQCFNNILSNPNSASYRIADAMHLRSPMSSLVNDITGNLNPAALLGWGEGEHGGQ